MRRPERRILTLMAILAVVVAIVAVGLALQVVCCGSSSVEATITAIVATNHAIATDLSATEAGGTAFAVQSTADTASRQPEQPTLESTTSPSVTSSATFQGTPVANGAISIGCVWQWARQDLPDVTRAAQDAFEKAGVRENTVRTEAYGENCLGADAKVQYFAAQTTDFYVTLSRDKLDDDTLAGEVKLIYDTLLTLPEDSLPARRGYLDITVSGRHLRAMFAPIQAALEQGLTGKDLLAVFGG
jgi:hypothetical protein